MKNLRSICVLTMLFTCGTAITQEKDRYSFGQDEQLEMVVHIFGEVNRPGEYRVTDQTNILELLSKALGPTEFANLTNIRITRSFQSATEASNGRFKTRLAKVNLDKYLQESVEVLPPKLQPDDVIYVPRNGWFKWRNIVSVARD